MNYTQYVINCLTESSLGVSVLDAYDKLTNSNMSIRKNGQGSVIETVRLSKEKNLDSFRLGVTLPINFESSKIYSFFSNLSSIITSPSETAFRNREKLVPNTLLTPEQTLNDFDDIFNARAEKDIFKTVKGGSSKDSFGELEILGSVLSTISPICKNILETSETLLSSTKDFISGLDLEASSDQTIDTNVLLNYSEIYIALKNIANIAHNYCAQYVYDLTYTGKGAESKYEEAKKFITENYPGAISGTTSIRKKSELDTISNGTWQMKNIYSRIDSVFSKSKEDIFSFTDSIFGKPGYSEEIISKEESLMSSGMNSEKGASKVIVKDLDFLKQLESILSFGDTLEFNTIATVVNKISNSIFPYHTEFGFIDGRMTDEQKASLKNLLSGRLSPEEEIIFENSLDSFIASDDPEVYNKYRTSPEFFILCMYLRCAYNKSYNTILELLDYSKSDEIFKLEKSGNVIISEPISSLKLGIFKDSSTCKEMENQYSSLSFKFIQLLSYLSPSRDFSIDLVISNIHSDLLKHVKSPEKLISEEFETLTKLSDISNWILEFGAIKIPNMTSEQYAEKSSSEDVDRFGFSSETPLDTAISIMNKQGFRFDSNSPSKEDLEKLDALLGYRSKKTGSYFKTKFNEFLFSSNSKELETACKLTGIDKKTMSAFLRNLNKDYLNSMGVVGRSSEFVRDNYLKFAKTLNLYMNVLSELGIDTDHRNIKKSETTNTSVEDTDEVPYDMFDPNEVQFESLRSDLSDLKNNMLKFFKS